MKLLVISHAYLERMYFPVLEQMATFPDVELIWICPEKYGGAVAPSRAFADMRIVPIQIRYGSRQGTFLYHMKALSEALDELRPDLIFHEQEVYSLAAGQVAATATRLSIPLVMYVCENVHRSLALPRRMLTRYVLSRSLAVVAGTAQTGKVHRDWGFKGPMAVIPQIGATVCAHPSYGRRGGETLRVCYVGRLVACKGIDCLLRALAGLHQSGLAVSCAIAGSGPQLVILTALARELGIKEQVRFCGQLSGDGVGELLRNSDVLVLPSRRTAAWEEQFGRVLTEAMAEATVTVGSKTGAIADVIGSEDLLFEQDDHRALARILERLARDVEFFEGHQRRLWRRGKELFGNDKLAAERIQFLRDVTGVTRPSVAHRIGARK